MSIPVDVSVIIPSFNRLWSLPKAIESCRNTRCAVEIIVVDDGSDDGTWNWLQEQTGIKSLFQVNQGQTYAINKGVAKATGKYIRFLDSDDFLCEGVIDKQFEKAEETSAELVYSKVNNYDYETGAIEDLPEIEPWSDFLEIQLSNKYGSHFLGMLFTTEWVKKVPRRPDFALREDRMFLLEYGLLNPKIAFLPGCAGYWVKHKTQMQANYSGLKAQTTNWQHLNIFKKTIKNLELNAQLTDSRKKAACSVLWPLAHWIAKDFINEGVNVVEWIYKLDPDFKIPEQGALGWMFKNFGFKTTEILLRFRRLITSGIN